jgi:hypothetical protein
MAVIILTCGGGCGCWARTFGPPGTRLRWYCSGACGRCGGNPAPGGIR